MANGSFRSNTGTNLDIVCDWQAQGNAETGKSSVRVKVYISHYEIYSAALSGSYVDVGGERRSFTAAVNRSQNTQSLTLIADEVFTVTHDASGKKSVTISCGWVFNGTYSGTYIGTLSASAVCVLDTLRRASVINSVSGGAIGEKLTISASVYSSAYKHKIGCAVGTESYTTGYITGSGLSCTLPSSLAYGVISSKTKSGTVTLYTYTESGSLIGQSSKSVTFSVPEKAAFLPTFDFAVTPLSSSSYVTGREIYASGVTRAQCVISGVSAKLGATVSSYEIRFAGVSHAGQSFTSPYLEAGDYSITAVVTDSRGHTSKKTVTITVEPYFAPYFTSVEAFRCNGAGVASEEGTHLNVFFETVVYPLDGYNTTYTEAVVTGRDGASVGKRVVVADQDNILNLSLSPEKSYTLTLTVRDSAGKSATHTQVIPTKKVDMHMRDGSVRFGGLIEKEGFDCSMDADFTGSFSLGGAPVADFVVDSGKTGIWTWRKWNSGVAECFGITESKTYSVTAAWGALYRSEANDACRNSAAYPEGLFADVPYTFADIKRTGPSVMVMKRDSGAKTASPNYFLVAPSSGNYDAALCIIAKGKWKLS